MEHRFRGKDGKYYWVLGRGAPVRNDHGEIIAWAGINLDINQYKKTEEELRNSERIYRAIGESLPFGIWICNPNGRNTYASQSLLDLLGVTQQQISEFGWGSSLHPDDAERTIAAWKECVRTEGVWDIEHRYRGVDGQYHPILARGVPVRDERGQITAWAGINLDISALKKAEEELRNSEHIYRSIGNSFEYGFWINDADGYVAYLSPSILELVGMTIEEVRADGWVRAIHPEDVARTLLAWRSFLENGGAWDEEFRVRAVDGRYRHVLGRGAPVRDSAGKIIAWAGFNLDITRLKHIEQDLRTSEERFRIALEKSPILVSTQDRDLRYTWVYNPALGRNVDQIVGKTDEDLVGPMQSVEMVAFKRLVLQTGIGRREEFDLPGPDGSLRTFDTTLEPLRDGSGAVTGLTVVAVDITESRQREKEMRENRLRVELRRRLLDQREQERLSLAREVHDGPIQVLSAINMDLDLARLAAADAATRRELGRLRRHLKQAVQELRDTVGELRSDLLKSMGLARAIRMHGNDFLGRHRRLEVVWSLAPDRNRLGDYASLALFRIYQEALSNIVKHSGATKATVRLSFTRTHAVLQVRDNGAGMDGAPDFMEQTARGHYGLAGMQERAEAVNGELRWKSAPGKGTTVTARIPIDKPAEPRPRRKAKAAA